MPLIAFSCLSHWLEIYIGLKTRHPLFVNLCLLKSAEFITRHTVQENVPRQTIQPNHLMIKAINKTICLSKVDAETSKLPG